METTGPVSDAEDDARARRHREDLAFVGRLLAGDPEAHDALRDRMACIPAMVRHHNRRLGRPLDSLDVEDAVRDTVAAVWSKLPVFEGRSTLETWVYRFAMLEVLKAVQRKQRAPLMLEDPTTLPERVGPDSEAPAPFDRADLEAGLASLSKLAADAIRMRHFDECSFDEIAERLGAPLNTVKARYYRGLARLKESLERRRRRAGS